MKKYIINAISFLMIVLFMLLSGYAFTQESDPPSPGNHGATGNQFPGGGNGTNGDPPPPPSGHGQMGNQPPGGGAPIGSGLLILISLGGAYGGKKLYDSVKRAE